MRVILHKKREKIRVKLQRKACESCLSLFAVGTKPKKLKPVLADLVPRFAGDGFDEGFEVIAFEKGGFSALPAEQKMLMTRGRCDECLAAVRLMDALDESLLFKSFQRAIDSDQPEGGMRRTRFIVHLDGGEGVCALCHDLNNGATRIGKAIALFI